jgi:CheY-like chemotaxis protein
MAHILVIDDDASILSLFGRFLESAGYSVALAPDGEEGMRLLKQKKPDLVITDIMMPGMDGLELLMKIRKQQLGIPVIAISGGMKSQPANFLPHAKKFGARRVFIKPVELAELLQAVQGLLSESAENK